MFYGIVGEDGKPAQRDGEQLVEPYVLLRQTGTPGLDIRGVRTNWLPPEGTIYLRSADRGVTIVDGVNVSIQASREDLVLAAAQALEPAPEG